MSADVIRYSYKHAPTLWNFSKSNAFMRGVIGPFRSGKSSGCCVEIIRRAQQQTPGPDGVRRTRWMVVRNTSGELRDTTIKTFLMWFPEALFGVFNKTHLNYTITSIPGCHIEVWFRALDRPDHIKHLLSLEVTGSWVNEAREIPWSIIEALQGRVAQYPSVAMGGCTWGGVILDTNPPDTESEWYNFFEIETQPPGFAEIFHQPSGLSDEAENIPYINGGRSYYERISTGKDQEWINVYVHGQYGFTKFGKAIFPEYSDQLHCRDVDPFPGLPIYRGFDFGLTPACVFSQLLPDQRWLIFDEMTSNDMSVEDFFDDVNDFSRRKFPRLPTFINVGDPAGNIRSEIDKRSCFLIAGGKGIEMVNGIQSPLVRLESVRKPLRRIINGMPQLVLNPRCKKVRKGFLGGYHYRQKKIVGEHFEDKPYKNEYSHPMDAVQYTATMIFGASVLSGIDAERLRDQNDEAYDDSTRSEHTGY